MLPCFVWFFFSATNPAPKNSAQQRGRAGEHLLNKAASRHYKDPRKCPMEQWQERGQHASASSQGQPGDARMEMSGSQTCFCPAFPGLQVLPVGPQAFAPVLLRIYTICLLLKAMLNGSPATSSPRPHLHMGPDAQTRHLIFLPLLYPHFTYPSRPRSNADATGASATTITTAAASSRKLSRPSPAHKNTPHTHCCLLHSYGRES